MDDKVLTMREATLCFLVSRKRIRLAEMLSGPFAGALNGYGGGIETSDSDPVSATLRELGPPEEYTPEELPLERMMLGDRLWLPRLLKGARLHAEIWYGPEQKSFDRQPIVSQVSIKELDRLWVRP